MEINKIILNNSEIKNGIDYLIERRNFLKDYINEKSAYTKAETIGRLENMYELKIITTILNHFYIQDFEIKNENEIIIE